MDRPGASAEERRLRVLVDRSPDLLLVHGGAADAHHQRHHPVDLSRLFALSSLRFPAGSSATTALPAITMDEEAFNLTIRRFLKEVGVTAQREIEIAVRDAVRNGTLQGDETLKARAIVTLDGVELHHEVEGEISLA